MSRQRIKSPSLESGGQVKKREMNSLTYRVVRSMRRRLDKWESEEKTERGERKRQSNISGIG